MIGAITLKLLGVIHFGGKIYCDTAGGGICPKTTLINSTYEPLIVCKVWKIYLKWFQKYGENKFSLQKFKSAIVTLTFDLFRYEGQKA